MGKLLSIGLLLVLLNHSDALAKNVCFPPDFLFGAGTSAFQVEGAWNVADKGESSWDRYTHQHPEKIYDHTNADYSADSYNLYKEDVRLLRQLGVQFYKFSISWPRVLPTGRNNNISVAGVKYYNALINELLKYGIKPLVTMYHYDLPQSLQELGGWTNAIIVQHFVDYAKVLFETFGDRVKGWITLNDPFTFCRNYRVERGEKSNGIETYLCGHNVLKAHGKVYRLYRESFKEEYNGFISITLSLSWMEPATQSENDLKAAERVMQFMLGWFAHPILSKEGDYPPIMRKRINEYSIEQKLLRSRLPYFTKEEVEMIRGSVDVLSLKSYTTYLVSAGDGKIDAKPSMSNDVDVVLNHDTSWPTSNTSWLRDVPWGLRKVLNWIKLTYNNPPVVIIENGVSTPPGLRDVSRVNYIDGYLRALHEAVTYDRCDVSGYTYWSLIDNFEWARGFSERFGLYQVDYTSPGRTRTPRLSAGYFHNVAKSGCLPTEYHNRVPDRVVNKSSEESFRRNMPKRSFWQML